MQYIPLRPYQKRAIAETYTKIKSGAKRIILVAPCGAGKTTLAAKVIQDAVSRGKRCLFMAHRKELLTQCSERLLQFGIAHDLVVAGDRHSHFTSKTVVIAGIQTLIARESYPAADVVIIDEAHRGRAKSYMRVIDENYQESILLGLTATPVRTDGKTLGKMFTDMVAVADVRELIDEGHLMDPVVYAPTTVDLSEVRSGASGDYRESDLYDVMAKSTITADIWQTWERLGKGRPTICFAVNRQHGMMLADMFKEHGVKVDYLDGKTGDATRDAIIDSFKSGKSEMIVNVSILTEGFDHPPTSCVILARPTKSLTVYMQACGRAMRPAPGKTDAIILDHAGCALRMGRPGDSRVFTMDDDDPGKQPSPVKICGECFAVVPASASVCECGYVFPVSVREGPEEVAGELVPLGRDQITCNVCNTDNTQRSPGKDQSFNKAYLCRTCKKTVWVKDDSAVQTATEDDKRAEYNRLRSVQARKGLKPGFPNSAYRAVFGKWPPKEWQ